MDDRRTLIWFGAFTLVVALAGVAGGVLLDRFALHPPTRVGRQAGPAPGRGGGPPLMRTGWLSERLSRELDLTAAQRDKLAGILAQRRSKLDQIRTEMQTRMLAEQQDVRAEIRAMLDDKQQKRFDEVMATAPGPWRPGLPPRGARRGQGPE